MTFKLSAAVAIARGVLNDTEEDYRYSTDDLVEYGNGALRALADIKPEWLEEEAEHTCLPGARQNLSANTAHSLVRVERIKDGAVVLPADRSSMDAFTPGWMSAAAGAPVNWFPDPGTNARAFLLYPPAAGGEVLVVRQVGIPSYSIDEDTGLPETIADAVADYIVGIAEARDDEHVLSGRSAQFIAQFAARVTGRQATTKAIKTNKE